MFSAMAKGVAAGAAGTTALNASTYLDMVVRARGASSMPEQTVEQLAKRAGQDIPGSGADRDNRVEALGALSGIAAGCGVGLVAGVFKPALKRLPLLVAGVLVGAAAMAATDLPMAKLGLTDLSSWTSTDWLADALPHLVYGLTTAATLRALD